MMEQKDLTYIAGIFDGEGCVCVVETKQGRGNTGRAKSFSTGLRYTLRVNITNTSLDLMNYLEKQIGYMGQVKPIGNGTIHFIINQSYHVEFLEMLLPYLIVKTRQAELGISYYKEGTKYSKNWSVGLGEVEYNRRKAIREEMQKLNGRKTTPYVSKRLQRLNERTPLGEATVWPVEEMNPQSWQK